MEKSVVKGYVKALGRVIVKDALCDVAAFAIVGGVLGVTELVKRKKGGSKEA